MHAGNNALLSLIDFLDDGGSDTRHDAHVDDHVSRVGKLDTDLRDGAANGTHGKGKNVHGAAAHAAFEEFLQLLPHYERIFPVIRRAGVVFRKRANESSIFNAGYVTWISARVIAAGPQLAVESGESSGVHKFLTKPLVLGL